MPIYEYACTVCGERTEARQAFTDPPLTECPVCEGKLRKLYSPVGIVFKGTGFYATESRKGGRSDSDSSKEGAQASKDGGASRGSDKPSGDSKPSGDGAKPAEKTATKSQEKN
ncbi:MAG: FmdB family transcriptional regulator [Actinobacteria bacterium]|nr:FmdB family transcriptional regulator [Actinomycetota bacterium]